MSEIVNELIDQVLMGEHPSDVIDELNERQKEEPTGSFPDEEPKTRKGAFKIGSVLSGMAKEHWGGKIEKSLFKYDRDYINSIEYNDLPKIWNVDNMADAQDVVAKSPKKAFQMWMRNVGKVAPRIGKGMRKSSGNIPLWFYMFLIRVSGRDMADIIIKKYFSAVPEYQAFYSKRKSK